MTIPPDLEKAAAPDEPEPVQRARSFLEGQGTPPTSLPDEVAEALVKTLTQRRDGEKLAQLAAAADKALAKRARRGLHLLRSRGVTVEVPRKEAPATKAQPQEAQHNLPMAMIGVPQGPGEYNLLCAISDPVVGQLAILQAVIREGVGLREFQVSYRARRDWRAVVHDLRESKEVFMAPIDSTYASWQIAEAGRQTESAGLPLPEPFIAIRQFLVLDPTPPRHPVYALVSAEAIAAASDDPERLRKIRDVPELRYWTPSHEVMREADQLIILLSKSTLLVDDAQRCRLAIDAVLELQTRVLSGPWRAQLVQRFLHAALVIAQSEYARKGRDFLSDAALLVSAAEQVADPAVPPENILVVRPLFESFLRILEEIRRTEPKKSVPAVGSSILMP